MNFYIYMIPRWIVKLMAEERSRTSRGNSELEKDLDVEEINKPGMALVSPGYKEKSAPQYTINSSFTLNRGIYF